MSAPSTESAPLRVVHLPWDEVNPYQGLLSRALRSIGVESIPGRNHRVFFVANSLRWKADVLHIHWPDALILNDSFVLSLLKSLSFLLQLLLCRLCGAKVVWTAHDLRSLEGRHPGLERLVMGVFVRNCARIIAHGPAAERALVKEYPALREELIGIIPHGPFDFGRPSVSVAEARRLLSLPKEAFVFLCFGQLRRYKGTDLLIEAFKSLKGRRRASLLVAGPPRDKEFAAAVSRACAGESDIRLFAGLAGPSMVERLFVAADAVVLPYRAGLSSGVAALAEGFSRRCLASKSVAALDALADSGAHFFEDLTPDGLRQGLQEMMESPSIPVRGRRVGWGEVARRTAEIYSATTARTQ